MPPARSLTNSGPAGVLIASLLFAGCGGSAYQRCRVGASFQQDPVARELALSRCEQVANREYFEKIHREEVRRERVAREAQEADSAREHDLRLGRERDSRYRDVRAHPRAVELGGTPKESAAICSRQGGQQHARRLSDGSGVRLVCTVGGTSIYVALVRNMETVFAVKTFYEDGDLPSLRRKLESELGPAQYSHLENGYRVWIWETTTPQVDLRSYDSGVAVTLRNGDDVPRPQPSGDGSGEPTTVVRDNPFDTL